MQKHDAEKCHWHFSAFFWHFFSKKKMPLGNLYFHAKQKRIDEKWILKRKI